jgi:hypothetical protein
MDKIKKLSLIILDNLYEDYLIIFLIISKSLLFLKDFYLKLKKFTQINFF